MSVVPVEAKLSVKVTYNVSDCSQLRLARHPATPVTVYEDSEDGIGASTSLASSSKKSFVGRFAELPLSVCLSALKDASPELISNPVYDYSIYVNDPTEAGSSTSGAGVLVGKGLLSRSLRQDSKDSENTVFGAVIKDGIRGEAVLVHLVLEKTPKASYAPPVPTPTMAVPTPVPDTLANNNANSNLTALLSILSTAYATTQHQPDHTQLLAALAAGVPPTQISLPISAAVHPAARAASPLIDVPPATKVTSKKALEAVDFIKIEEDDDEIIEIPSPSSVTVSIQTPTPTASTSGTVLPPITVVPPRPVAADKENIAPPRASEKLSPTVPMQKSKSTSSLQLRTAASATQPLTHSNFLPLPPALASRTNLPLPVPGFSSPAVPKTGLPAVVPTKKRGGKRPLPGPHGNGWYRRSELPGVAPVPSSDAPTPTPLPVVVTIPTIAKKPETKKKPAGKKRPSDPTAESGPAKKAKVVPESSPIRRSQASGVPTSPFRPTNAAATSPVRKVKKIKLKSSGSANAAPMVPVPPMQASEPVEKPIRKLNFLSLNPNVRNFQRARSDSVGLGLVRGSSVTPFPVPAWPRADSAAPMSSIAASSPFAVAPPLPTDPPAEDDRPKTPKSDRALPLPKTPHKTPRPMDIDDEGDSSPLFLPTPQQSSKSRAVSEPVTPTRKPTKSAEELAIETAFDFDDDEDDESDEVEVQVGPALEDIVASSAPLDYNALGLPPSSPPSSLASSSPSTSPRFTVEDELMAEEEEGEATPDLHSEFPLPDLLQHREAVEPSSPRTEEAPIPLTSENDLQCLVDILGMVNVPSTSETLKDPQQVLPDMEFWNALLLNPASASTEETQEQSLHGSDIFDFGAAHVDGLVNSDGVSSSLMDGYESLLEAL